MYRLLTFIILATIQKTLAETSVVDLPQNDIFNNQVDDISSKKVSFLRPLLLELYLQDSFLFKIIEKGSVRLLHHKHF